MFTFGISKLTRKYTYIRVENTSIINYLVSSATPNV